MLNQFTVYSVFPYETTTESFTDLSNLYLVMVFGFGLKPMFNYAPAMFNYAPAASKNNVHFKRDQK